MYLDTSVDFGDAKRKKGKKKAEEKKEKTEGK